MDQSKIEMPRDFYGASLAEVEDEVRFRCARPGDHLLTTFQCPQCQSQNIRNKALDTEVIGDLAFEALCMRATLDAFWSHSSKTVAGHVTEVNFLARYAEMVDVNPFPNLGPWPLGRHLGMLTAIMVLMRSMEPGKDGETVKFGTARQIRSTLTVLWDSSPESGNDMMLTTSKRGRYISTLNPAEGRWYEMFTTGVTARIGDVVKQDRAYTIEELHRLLEMYEQEWNDLGLDMAVESVSACMFLLVSCLGGMRGFEVVWTDLSALRYDVKYCEERGDFEAVSWPIVGRFKNEHGRLGHYMIPIAGLTSSGIHFFRWTQRFIRVLYRAGITSGWAFQQSDGSRAKAGDYRDNIFSKLKTIQSTTTLIDADVNVWEEYGIQRSGRRFFVTHCIKCGILPHVVEYQCRWQTDRANRNKTVTRSMLHTYSEVRNMKDVLIQPSKAF